MEPPVDEQTITEFSAKRSGYLNKEGIVTTSEWTNNSVANSYGYQVSVDRTDPMPMEHATNQSVNPS